MKPLFVLGLALMVFVPQAALSEEAQLVLRVKRNAKEGTTAFVGVTDFEIFRGSSKFTEGSCPDASDKEGKLVCILKCSAGDAVAKSLRVVPPGKSLKVRGYVAPAPAEVKLEKCALQPKGEQEFVYVDPRLALAQLLKEDPKLTNVASVDTAGEVLKFHSSPASVAALEELGTTPLGRSKLLKLQGYAAAAGDSPWVTPKDREVADALPAAIGSVYLKEAVRQAVGNQAAGGVTVEFSKDSYYANLRKVEKELDAKPSRTRKENILLEGVENWKSAPAQASITKILGTM